MNPSPLPAISLTQLRSSSWKKVVNDRGIVRTAGACYNTSTINVKQLKKFFSGFFEDLPPDLRMAGFQVDAFNKLKNPGPLTQGTVLPPLYESGLHLWEPHKDEMKKSLPALVPSVYFIPQESLSSPKRQAAENPASWKHSGFFGIDLDLGENANGTDPAKLFRRACKEAPEFPGFCFLFQSPSGGIKVLLRVDDATVELLNTGTNKARWSLHRQLFLYLASMIEAKGFSVDLKCSDVTRLQFLYRDPACKMHLFASNGGEPFVFDRDKLAEAQYMCRSLEVRGGEAMDRPMEATEDKPKILLDFAGWLRLAGRKELEEAVLNMKPKPGDPTRYVSWCPCCKDVCKGARADTDLSVQISADNQLFAIWNCFHASCYDDKLVPMNMSDYWRAFIASYESLEAIGGEEELSYRTTPLLSRIYQAPRRSFEDFKFLPPYYVGWFPDVVPSSEKDLKKADDMEDPQTVQENRVFHELKYGKPVFNMVNLDWFLRNCLNIIPYLDISNKCLMLFDTYRGTVYDLNNEMFSSIYSRINDFFPKPNNEQVMHHLRYIAQRTKFHALMAMAYEKPWDGKDRVTEVFHSLVLNPDWEMDISNVEASDLSQCPFFDPSKELTRGFTDSVLYVWFINLWRRVLFANNMLDSREVPQTAFLILNGPQGKGKNRWVSACFSKFGSLLDEVSECDPKSKDTLMKLSSTVVIHFEELENMLSTEEKQGALKALISKSHVKVRPPYGRQELELAVQSSFIGTTNQEKFLSDDTGTRRYFVINISSVDMVKMSHIDKQQFWAQIRYLSEEASEKLSFASLEPLTDLNNTRNSVIPSQFAHLVPYLVYIKKDWEVPGLSEPVERFLPYKFTTAKNIIETLLRATGDDSTRVDNGRKTSNAFFKSVRSYFGVEAEDLNYVRKFNKSAVQLRRILPRRYFEALVEKGRLALEKGELYTPEQAEEELALFM